MTKITQKYAHLLKTRLKHITCYVEALNLMIADSRRDDEFL